MTDGTFAAMDFKDILHRLDRRFGLSADCQTAIYAALMSAYRRGREDGYTARDHAAEIQGYIRND